MKLKLLNFNCIKIINLLYNIYDHSSVQFTVQHRLLKGCRLGEVTRIDMQRMQTKGVSSSQKPVDDRDAKGGDVSATNSQRRVLLLSDFYDLHGLPTYACEVRGGTGNNDGAYVVHS